MRDVMSGDGKDRHAFNLHIVYERIKEKFGL